MSSEKTHDPTAARQKKAVEQGDLLQSRDLATAIVFGSGVAALYAIGPWLFDRLRVMLASALVIDRRDIVNVDPAAAMAAIIAKVAVPVALLIGIAALAAVAVPAMLGSFGFNTGAIQFKGSRLNPAAGLKRMVSLQGAVELAKAACKAALVGGVGVWLLWRQSAKLSLDYSLDVARQGAALVGDAGLALAMLAGALMLIALIDVPVQFFRRRTRLRMTRQEVVDDNKQSDGSPELRSAIRQRQQEILSRSVRTAMAEAHLIITNPSHFAVALRYDPERDAAPIILARGRDAKAAAMRSLAAESSAPIVSHPSLARAIYFTGREGQMIHADLFRAVATVLAFVRQVDRQAAVDLERMAPVPPTARYNAAGDREP